MSRDLIVKRLVEELGDLDTSNDENLPIEYYEMRDYAKTRVLLKSSIKSHTLIFILVNAFLLLSNFFADPKDNFLEMWSIWVLAAWGLLLWSHFVIVYGIIDIDDIDRKIFAIISLILSYIGLLIIFINYLANFYGGTTYLWWYWVLAGICLVIGSYAYVVYQTDERGHLKNKIEKEMKKIQVKAIKNTEKDGKDIKN